MADTGVTDQDIHITNLRKGLFYGKLVCHIAADGGGAGLAGDSLCCGMVLFIKEKHPVAPGGKEFHSGCADTSAAAGDHDGFQPLHLLRCFGLPLRQPG